MELILASNSPRRREILTKMGYSFSVIPSSFDENGLNLLPSELCTELAYQKAKDVFDKENREDIAVLGADTIVCLGNEVLGKPKDRQDAFDTLKKLSGKAHQVITGYAVI